jgi:hypothetical protein
MLANAGIQVRFRSKFNTRLDSGFRRKDGIRVDFQSTDSKPLGLKPRVIQFLSFSSRKCRFRQHR